MINGGNNGYVGAFVYSTPNADGTYDLLIVTMSGEQGDLTYMYMTQIDHSDIDALANAKLTMQGSKLSIIPKSDGFHMNIKINCD